MSSSEGKLLIFSDGACSGNPGPGGWAAILAHSDGWVKELGGRVDLTTNNRMELTAVICALEAAHAAGCVIEIFTDSTYVIRGITEWASGWEKRGWLSAAGKPVANVDLWQVLLSLTHRQSLRWHYVRGHQGTPGNERADVIAVQFSRGVRVALYEGSRVEYGVNLEDIPQNTALP